MANAKRSRIQNHAADRQPAAANRKIEPPRKAPETERSLANEGYLRVVRQLSPDQISEDQLRKFFLHLKNDKSFASGSLRVAFSGVKFFYTRTCRRDWQTLAQMKIQNVKSLPIIAACRIRKDHRRRRLR